jgi:dTDP-4-amino-4,6-dideoxygalactose transaminase
MQPPVVSTVSARGIGAALVASARRGGAPARLERALAERFGARRVVLTDSGTSALVLALRAALPANGTVLLPAYACVDLLAAAEAVDARVRLYDVDPTTLSPDLVSVEAGLRRGAHAVVVAHLFGFPADVPGVAALAATHGAAVIEDAAQGAGGALGGRLLGSFGPLTVLSFGRGKGVTGGGGGALLAFGAASDATALTAGARRVAGESAGAGITSLGVTAAQWLLARPALYAIPSSLPFLKLGETVYHPAHDARPIAGASAALAANALARADAEAQSRARIAEAILGAAGRPGPGVHPLAGGRAGYLRLPVRRADASPAPELGVLRGYPKTLADYDALHRLLCPGEAAGPGAAELRDTLFTLPTHHHVRDADVRRLAAWLQSR